jgi:hypothetical protein
VLKCFVDTVMGHAMVEVVSCQPLTTEAWVYSRRVCVGFVVEEVVLGQVPPTEYFGLPLSVSMLVPHAPSYIHHHCYIN